MAFLLLRASRSELELVLGFEIGLSVGVVMVAPVGSPIGYSINMLLGLSLVNYFDT